ncbi:MAG TPA: CHAT domain-containing protein [Methylomirabilota bacterium]|jgi:hypothetical protein|nr:CHAT domain-containing protein [Methylomirabilota bacterium]
MRRALAGATLAALLAGCAGTSPATDGGVSAQRPGARGPGHREARGSAARAARPATSSSSYDFEAAQARIRAGEGAAVRVAAREAADKDRASFALMRRFYDVLAAQGPAEALRRAQRAGLGETPHPFFWAAFGVAGSPR